MHRLCSLSLLLSIPLLGTSQTAEQPKKPPPAFIGELLKLNADEFLKKFDQNKDGFAARSELPPFLEKAFDRADKNSDNKLDRAEVDDLLRTLRQFFGGQSPVIGPKEVDAFVDVLLKKFDANSDGKISKEEAKDRLADAFATLDKNKDSFLDRPELRPFAEKALALPKGPFGGPGPLGGAGGADFDDLDKNADGRLSRAELKGTPWAARFEEIDVNKDGLLDRREFENAVRKGDVKK